MPFSDLALSDALLKAVGECGYDEPTAIQAAAIPLVLMGKDLIGVAQTGTGKTASFVLPMIDILAEGRARARMPRSLILEPTRELAAQVAENVDDYTRYHKLAKALLIGGVAFGDQDRALAKGADILIATPGRLLDQHERGKLLLSGVEILVIDEADRMLDMGFIPDVERICALLKPDRQTLLFSATMPAPIKKLADRFMTAPKMVQVARPATTNRNIRQKLLQVTPRGKRQALRQLLADPDVTSCMVFCNRKTTVRDLDQSLRRYGFHSTQIHGDMDQPDRVRELERFRAGGVSILVASDVAARGLDVDDVSHVINFDVPIHPDDYVHRVGRTGRAGRTGIAITLATPEDAEAVARIEELTGQKIERTGSQPAAARAPAPDSAEKSRAKAAKAAPRARGGKAPAKDTKRAASAVPEARTAVPEARADARVEAAAETAAEAGARTAAGAEAEAGAAAAPKPPRARPAADHAGDSRHRAHRHEVADARHARSGAGAGAGAASPQQGAVQRRRAAGTNDDHDRERGTGPGFGDQEVPAFLGVSAFAGR